MNNLQLFILGQKAELMADKDDSDSSQQGIEIVEDPEIMRKLEEDKLNYEQGNADEDDGDETMQRVF